MESTLNLIYFLIDNKIRSNFNGIYSFYGKTKYYHKNINFITYSQVTIIINQNTPSKIIILKSNVFISENCQKYKYNTEKNCLKITSNPLKMKGFYKIEIFKI
ncbi:hypothetical protein [Acinetobacter guillouiae]|uniref:hypothetical protein n=1 Tax=Acinetobacter guillouiae TaxID=106649 RepID=UPI0026E1B992|nr:hypothetical protein [Acinetobacter guillouiae]MDO6646448.1 hypothetical protein [Acinetobacter guillouiae]